MLTWYIPRRCGRQSAAANGDIAQCVFTDFYFLFKPLA
jgi:hypothetical protein